jgi:hypothetical protein
MVGARQARNVIALKEPDREVLGAGAKMLKGALQRPQRGDLIAPRCQVRPIAFTDAPPGVLFWVGQDMGSLMHESIGPLQGRPQGRRRLQAFRQEVL